jgi:hypothetical protein
LEGHERRWRGIAPVCLRAGLVTLLCQTKHLPSPNRRTDVVFCGVQCAPPYECLEGDYAIKNALSADRAEDKAIEQDAKRGIIRPRRGIQYANQLGNGE